MVVIRARRICINCGDFIARRAASDPQICRNCEKLMEGLEIEERMSHMYN